MSEAPGRLVVTYGLVRVPRGRPWRDHAGGSETIQNGSQPLRVADHCHVPGVQIDDVHFTEVRDHHVLRIESDARVTRQSHIGPSDGMPEPGEICGF